MKLFFQNMFVDPFQQLSAMVHTYLPHVFAAFAIFLCGLVLAWLLGKLAGKTARLLKIDQASKNSEFARLLKKANITKRISDIVEQTFYWIILFIFSILSLSALKIPAMDALLAKFILFIPSFFIAVVLLVLGYIIALFSERALLIMMVNRGLHSASIVSRSIKYLLLVITVTMSFEQLGIAHATLLIFFSIVFGGVVFSLSLAFGLGGKELAKEYLSGFLKKEKRKDSDSFSHL